jgi:hypothetical protein
MVGRLGGHRCVLLSRHKVSLTEAALDGTAPDLDLTLLPGVAFDEECNRVSDTSSLLIPAQGFAIYCIFPPYPLTPCPARTGQSVLRPLSRFLHIFTQISSPRQVVFRISTLYLTYHDIE